MQWIPYAIFVGLAAIAIAVGVAFGGGWWIVTGAGLVVVAACFAVDRHYKRRETGGERAAAEMHPKGS